MVPRLALLSRRHLEAKTQKWAALVSKLGRRRERKTVGGHTSSRRICCRRDAVEPTTVDCDGRWKYVDDGCRPPRLLQRPTKARQKRLNGTSCRTDQTANAIESRQRTLHLSSNPCITHRKATLCLTIEIRWLFFLSKYQ